ncbi:MAG: IS66 family transposase [Alphaproteobacteria bacterium]|nr:IS66 family transposase [Alphaproteobacteria bacterium]
MNIDVAELPDDSVLLKQKLVEFQILYEKEMGIMLEQIRLLRAQLFGRKSEKRRPDKDAPQPLFLFDVPEPEEIEPDEDDNDSEKVFVPAHSRKKSGRKALPDDLPRIEVVHDIDDNEKICACGCELSRIGEEVSEQLDIIPAKIQVICHIRPKYACKNCEGVQDDGPTVKIAAVAPQIIPKSIATPGLIAHVLTGKFVDHTPFYRQEKQFIRLGVDVSRASMCNWAMRAALFCQPLLNLIQDEILAGILINIDETPLQVLREPGRSPTSKSYMWIFRRGDPENPAIVFQYHPNRSGDVPKAFLRGFKGYVQTDAYAGYNFLEFEKDIHHIGCWAHARRNFMDVIKAQGKTKNRKTGSGDQALSYIQKLYRFEKEARTNELSPEAVYKMRQEKAKPILTEFKKWLTKKSTQTPPKGLLGKAVSYTLKQWDRLVGYLENGHLTIDNNMAENSIRPFVIGRKNWLFAGTPKGAEASALLYSLIETAKANKLEPYAYLRHIFEKLPTASTLQDFENLLPWNIDQAQLTSFCYD